MSTVTESRSERVRLADLTEYPGNARHGDVPTIAASLRRRGQYKPLVISSDGVVLAGNHTLAAMRELGWEDADVWRLPIDSTDPQAAEIVLVDNRTADLGTYDPEALVALLESVPSYADAALGYSRADMAELLASITVRVPKADPDDVPEPPKVPYSKPGQVWQLGRHRLMCGDSTSRDDVTTLMDGQRAHLLATDPPYLVDYDGSNHPQSTVNSAMTKDKAWDSYVDPTSGQVFYDDFLRIAFDVAVVEESPVYQWHADMRRLLVVGAWEANGLLAHQTVTWVKSRPVLTRSDFMWQHEPCLYGWRKGKRPPVDRRPPANATSVWELDQRQRNDIHPTEKPVELFARPLRWHLHADEIAYEPFSGSGSQIIAAEMTQRRCFAMELAPEYVDAAARRWQEFTGDLPVDAATGDTHDFTQETGDA